MSERRIDPRTDEVTEVILTVQSSMQNPQLANYSDSCLMTDLSVSGICLNTYRPPPEDALVEVMIRLQRPLRVFRRHGRVMRVQNQDGDLYSVGIRFTDTENDRMKEWEEVVEHLLSNHA